MDTIKRLQSRSRRRSRKEAQEMNRPTLEVADLIRHHCKDFIESNRSRPTWQQLKVMRAIEHGRTAVKSWS
jgi:hypothetical protein